MRSRGPRAPAAAILVSVKSRRHVPSAWTEEQRSLELRADLTLRLAVVADTHSRPHPRAYEWIAAREVDAILHGGDIGDLKVLEELAELAPVVAVRGNIDERVRDLPDVVHVSLHARDSTVLRLLLTHIAVRGPKLRADVAQLAQASQAALVVCGHSHVPFIGRDRGVTLFNPGSMGPRRMHLPIVFGMLEIREGKLRLSHVDCETGEPWRP